MVSGPPLDTPDEGSAFPDGCPLSLLLVGDSQILFDVQKLGFKK